MANIISGQSSNQSSCPALHLKWNAVVNRLFALFTRFPPRQDCQQQSLVAAQSLSWGEIDNSTRRSCNEKSSWIQKTVLFFRFCSWRQKQKVTKNQ